MEKDIILEQRFLNFKKAFHKLSQAVDYTKNHEEAENSGFVLNEIIKEGLIQRFEYTHELAWNVMKDYAEYQGNFQIKGSRDSTREGFKMNLISEGETWMSMIKSRNDTSHTYNEETAEDIYNKIISEYYPAFVQFIETMGKLLSANQLDLF